MPLLGRDLATILSATIPLPPAISALRYLGKKLVLHDSIAGFSPERTSGWGPQRNPARSLEVWTKGRPRKVRTATLIQIWLWAGVTIPPLKQYPVQDYRSFSLEAELLALTWALLLGKGKRVNIYPDCKQALTVVHVHRAIWKERGLLTSGGKEIKHTQEILNLLKAVMESEEVTVMHCPGHQKAESLISQGNHKADQASTLAAWTKTPTSLRAALIRHRLKTGPACIFLKGPRKSKGVGLHHTPERCIDKQWRGNPSDSSTPNGRVNSIHQSHHYGQDATLQ